LLFSGSTFWVSISGSPFTKDFHQSIWSCFVKRIEMVFWSSGDSKWYIWWVTHIYLTVLDGVTKLKTMHQKKNAQFFILQFLQRIFKYCL
jgi:hypothetical protein